MNDDSMPGDALELSALDPTRDAARFNTMAASIARSAMTAREQRLAAPPPELLAELLAWARPALAAAAIVLGVALPTLAYARPRQPVGASAEDVMGIPHQLTELLRSTRTPSLTQLHDALASTGAGAP